MGVQPYISILKLIFNNIFVFFVYFSSKNVYQNETAPQGIGINEYLKKVIYRPFVDYTFRLKILILVKTFKIILLIEKDSGIYKKKFFTSNPSIRGQILFKITHYMGTFVIQ